jgi:hypothetical protein
MQRVVSVFGSSIAQSLANLGPAEQARAQDRLKGDLTKAKSRPGRTDRPDEVVLATEKSDTVRSLKDYSEEEAREDRRASYQPDGAPAERDDEHALDVNG